MKSAAGDNLQSGDYSSLRRRVLHESQNTGEGVRIEKFYSA